MGLTAVPQTVPQAGGVAGHRATTWDLRRIDLGVRDDAVFVLKVRVTDAGMVSEDVPRGASHDELRRCVATVDRVLCGLLAWEGTRGPA